MNYRIKEAFYSLQGEGKHSGRPAIFCRFSHCNLWTGKEADRAMATCQFCDTDFVGTDGQNGGVFATAESLVNHLLQLWPTQNDQAWSNPFVVLTGGEPLLQVDETLINHLHQQHFEVAVETNGTLNPPAGLDWICVSPKANAPLLLTSGDELKLVYPQTDLLPEKVAQLDFKYFYLQPMDETDPVKQKANQQAAIRYCLDHPQWQLSLQTHKLLGID
ncbi:7-carboxy-7-deazaguanine synthase [Hydrogenovibrio sp. SC-1]|uniref:7-carboxy-7-deazaguanine synthase n=1 Tax=Hydrogenovibrio sp. SC-1 TaxID=2065820 RepID=UPI000C7CC026|nr:7-carboxy-7-deazaguanine synthase [Hydrogenovibrio sp. SC-1]PLA74190.1 7-carboxy-7-deazaguanine synthase [Hydrogenovibrio sp. SC-1]